MKGAQDRRETWAEGAAGVPSARSVAGPVSLPFIGPAPGGTGGSPSREKTAGTSPSFAWLAVPMSTLPPGPGRHSHGANRAIRDRHFEIFRLVSSHWVDAEPSANS